MMPLHHVVRELEEVTQELSDVCLAGNEGLETILDRRASIARQIAALPPSVFTPADLEGLRTALRNGNIIMEELTLKRRRIASEWLRLNMRKPVADMPATGEISLCG